MIQEPDFGSLMPDTFVDLGNNSYGGSVDDYQARVDDFDLRGPNAQYLPTVGGAGEGGEEGDCCAAARSCGNKLAAALAEIAELEEALEEVCSKQPPDGNWSANQLTYTNITTGTCAGYAHYGQQYNSASLGTNLTFLGNQYGNGYKLTQTTATVTALYRIKFSDGLTYPPESSQLNADGSSICMGLFGSIEIKKYNPLTGTFSSSQPGVSSGASGIGSYGIFHRSNYNRVNPLNGENPYQLSWLIKSGAEDVFEFGGLSSDPCSVEDPDSPTKLLSYSAGENGSITGPSQQAIASGSSGLFVTASPITGYVFSSWSDGSTENPRQDVGVAGNINVTASFIQE
jgi:hypothetical protein